VRELAEVLRDGRLLGHTMAETYAVLTAPGGPFEAPGESVVAYLERFLGREPVWLQPARYLQALTELERTGIAGGAIYDGLIAVAARDAGVRLVSLDRRAVAVYARVGVTFQLVA
jgi:hypothetical protein